MSQQNSLKSYRKKRDFRKTPEPSGKSEKPSRKPMFVVQKHDASTLHYDFRLEVDGVLKSWAVPKGPSTDHRQKRLAVPTEDHPLEYVPEGQYGAGVVLVWDKGTYDNLREKKEGKAVSKTQSVEEGKIEVHLEGAMIRGGYALFRTGKRGDKRWLLVKMKDDGADARRNPISTQPESVLSGRTLKEIARNEKDGSETR
jgi:DNA ligase D-like protein (predicted 3'-phosphoesterase)